MSASETSKLKEYHLVATPTLKIAILFLTVQVSKLTDRVRVITILIFFLRTFYFYQQFNNSRYQSLCSSAGYPPGSCIEHDLNLNKSKCKLTLPITL